jgi:hypothetical protein
VKGCGILPVLLEDETSTWLKKYGSLGMRLQLTYASYLQLTMGVRAKQALSFTSYKLA